MLYTNLSHIETACQYKEVLAENENVVIVCGRMGNQCVSVYRLVKELEKKFRHINFFDMEYDNPESIVVLDLPEVKPLFGTPLVLFFRMGKIKKAFSGVYSRRQLASLLDSEYEKVVKQE